MESKKFEDFQKEASRYRKILQEYKRTKKPFVDPNFHPTLHIKEREVSVDDSNDSWIRVDEVCPSPLFQKELIDSDYVQQGELGDCYFLSALSRIAQQHYLVPFLFDRDTPDRILGPVKDSINIKSGAIVIYFNCFGRKTPVLIDTLLPARNGRLIFSHPSDNSKSAWFCLVEKAYAKLNNSYSDIIGGTLPHAIYSLYGYYPKNKDFDELMRPDKLSKSSVFERIMKYQSKGAVIGTSINLSKIKGGIDQKAIEDKGLIPGHCYLLVKARECSGKNFLCLRNPWGDHEWNGDYSDESPKWTSELKEELGWKNADDGTFWMIESDYFRYFTTIEISIPLQPEWYSRHYYVQLKPGDHDGYNVESEKAKIAERPNFAFQVIDPIPKGEKCRFHILIEKRRMLYDPEKELIYKPPLYGVLLAHSNGKKLSPDVVMNSNRFMMQSSMPLLEFTSSVSGNDDIITIVIHRLQKCNLIEDCYVHIFCEKNFNLYDIDYPDELIPEEANNEIVFDNSSVKHPKVANPLILAKIKNKEAIAFGDEADKDNLREELIFRYKEEIEKKETASNPETNSKTDTNSQQNTDSKSENDSKTETDSESEKDSESESEKSTESESEKNSESESEKSTESESEKNSESESEKNTESESEKNTESESEKNTESESEKNTESESEKNTESESEKDSESETDLKQEINSKPEINSNFDEKKSSANPAKCFFVASNLCCKNLVYNNCSDCNSLVRFRINDDFYETETIMHNTNPNFKDIIIPVNDLENESISIEVLHNIDDDNDQQNLINIGSSLKLSLKSMEINPSLLYKINTQLSSEEDEQVGTLSFNIKLCLEKDLELLQNNDNISNFNLEIKIDEARFKRNQEEANVYFYLVSNEKQKYQMKTNQKTTLQIENAQEESLIFYFSDEKSQEFSDGLRVRLNQIDLNVKSVMETEMSNDEEIIGYLKVHFSMIK